ncbi:MULTISPECIES: DUF3341 domain-containing protein [Reichenbachiella]|uniref:Quinol:cytochrome c oxidoreductase membrane protein n=1 Tax=Reichenbachiella agariperforans TaxID=156994 RepID=A0A1M6RG75_REIAG|nr:MULTISPECIES: DUF3341 domain-containing protein [Reichenbachiella]MBU2915334.1 DUF3341 domain-containing protein [Reichenbachiella agariperforans]RJE70556.1 quinol:cytochrome C oxidoreductase [Reichenbachiella sp. MSK19-1]SHK31462.1 Protein of unknown function [Reichenbachiella agariperforans]
MSGNKNFVLGVYDDEDLLLKAIKDVRQSGVKIYEVFSPFPVHGIDDVLGYKGSRLSVAAFIFGLLGTTLALTMQIGMMTFDWPMIIGGKDFFPFPTFIPVTFELTVLLGAFGMCGTFFVVSNLKPWAKPRIFDLRITDDKHIVAVDLDKNSMSEEEIKKALAASGAQEVNNKSFE